MDGLAHRAGADGGPIPGQAGDLNTLDPGLGQLLAHDLVVETGHMAGALLAHIAPLDPQPLGDLTEDPQVQLRLGPDDGVRVLQKIAGEGGGADEIGAGGVAEHVGQILNALLHQLPPDGGGDGA